MELLKQGITYDFRVIAVNDYGYGSPSLPSPSISGEICPISLRLKKKHNRKADPNSSV